MPHGLDEGGVAVVAGVVVGERDGVEAAAQDGQRVRLGAEGGDLAGVRLAAAGDRAFEVGDAVVGLRQDGGERREWVATLGDRLAGAVGEHDVAGEDQRDGFAAGEAGQQAEQGDGCGQPEETAIFTARP